MITLTPTQNPDGSFTLAWDAPGWSSVEYHTEAELRELGWDGTATGLTAWLQARLWLRACQDQGLRVSQGWDGLNTISVGSVSA